MIGLLANNAGDPDTWPEAVAYIGIAWAVVALTIGWWIWGRTDDDPE